VSFCQKLAGCCPNKNSFERSLKRFLRINLGAAEDQRFELFEPEGRVFKSPGASLRFIKKRFRPSEKGFGIWATARWHLTLSYYSIIGFAILFTLVALAPNMTPFFGPKAIIISGYLCPIIPHQRLALSVVSAA
jgi:hypothetical protein